MLVKDIMGKSVLTSEETMFVKEIVETMTKNDIDCVLVLDSKKSIKGIITERDILVLVAEGKDPQKTQLKDIMTKDVFFIKPDTDILVAAELMVAKKIKKLPVIQNGALVGMLTATDIVAYEPKFMSQVSALFLSNRQKPIAG